jgi:hypothetical protein
MAIARASTHAVLLGDGRVLVVGTHPYPEIGDTAKAEIWDPATGAWHPTASLNNPRIDFAAVSLADGRALVSGGMNATDQSFSSAYVYTPGSDNWSKVGLLERARTSPAAAVLGDGRVLVAGGYFRIAPTYGRVRAPETVLAAYHPPSLRGSPLAGPRIADIDPPNVGAALATAELFDPLSGNWSTTGPLKYARFGAAAATLADGRVLVVGSGSGESGVTVNAGAYDSAELYDPKTGRFSLTGPLPEIDRSALQELGEEGASPVPESDPVVSEVGTLVALDDGGAVLIAHAGWWKHVGEITRSFRFDARAGRWSEIGQTFVFVSDQGDPEGVPLVTRGVRRLADAMVARLPDGRVLVAGGAGDIPEGYPYSNTFTAAVVEIYDPANNTWSAMPSMPEARAGGAVVVLADGSILLVGGYDDPKNPDGFSGDRIDLPSAIRFVP